MKLFNTSSMDIINNCRQYFDVKLPSTLWSDRVGRFEKKFAECDDLSLQNFSLNSIIYIYLLVKFLFCLFFCFFSIMLICHQLWWMKMYYIGHIGDGFLQVKTPNQLCKNCSSKCAHYCVHNISTQYTQYTA